MNGIDARDRERTMDRLEAERFDVVVIGGGIGGAGIAREAARRGLRVALLEAEDFAAGTSSRSSKLIHGGLRYLAMGDVPLVRTTALERKEVRRIAPHLAEPRWMVVPARSRASLLKFQVGITTYEKLGAVDGQDAPRDARDARSSRARSRCSTASDTHTPAPIASTSPTTPASSSRTCGARRATARRCSRTRAVTGLLREGDRAAGVAARCTESGATLHVRAKAVVNAAGPWVDALVRLETDATAPRLHLSKGVHVVLPAARLPVRHLAILGTDDRRSIFAIPRGDVVYLGTTDTSYSGGSDLWPAVTREDVEYLLSAARTATSPGRSSPPRTSSPRGRASARSSRSPARPRARCRGRTRSGSARRAW